MTQVDSLQSSSVRERPEPSFDRLIGVDRYLTVTLVATCSWAESCSCLGMNGPATILCRSTASGADDHTAQRSVNLKAMCETISMARGVWISEDKLEYPRPPVLEATPMRVELESFAARQPEVV